MNWEKVLISKDNYGSKSQITTYIHHYQRLLGGGGNNQSWHWERWNNGATTKQLNHVRYRSCQLQIRPRYLFVDIYIQKTLDVQGIYCIFLSLYLSRFYKVNWKFIQVNTSRYWSILSVLHLMLTYLSSFNGWSGKWGLFGSSLFRTFFITKVETFEINKLIIVGITS